MSLEKPKPTNQKLPEFIEVAKLSEASQDVLEHFGVESPNLLNVYCCALEDALVEQVTNVARKMKEIKRLQALLEEHNLPYGEPPKYKP